jgi:phage terminase large subunit GpA-like protein
MHVRWVTVFLDEDPDNALEETLRRRNRKTKAYKTGGVILCLGLVLYCISIALMLLDPVVIEGPVR